MTTSSSPSSSPPTSWSPGDAYLDLTGEVCPYTFVRTRLALEELPLGAWLRVFVDHEPAQRNVPRSARAWGQAVREPVAHERGWLIDLQKRVA